MYGFTHENIFKMFLINSKMRPENVENHQTLHTSNYYVRLFPCIIGAKIMDHCTFLGISFNSSILMSNISCRLFHNVYIIFIHVQ